MLYVKMVQVLLVLFFLCEVKLYIHYVVNLNVDINIIVL